MNRFEHLQPNIPAKIAFLLPLTFSVLLLFAAVTSIQTVEKNTLAKQQESLENALARGIAQCYAVEGTYPRNLSYLQKHYGLTYDENQFFVDYTYYGSNLLPEVTVLRKNTKQE